MRQLALIVVLAASVRTVSASVEVVIEHDSARYYRMADDLSRGDWSALDIYPFMPPLYPLLVAAVKSGPAVSIFFGALTCVPVFFLARRVWNERIARISSILYAVTPLFVIRGGQTMTEATFIFFFTTSVALLAAEARAWRWGLAGLSGGAAYLTRPEGVYVLPMIAGWAVLSMIKKKTWKPYAPGALAGMLAFFVVASPYLSWVHQKTGRWTFTASPIAEKILKAAGGRTEESAEGRADVNRLMEKYGVALGGAMTLGKLIVEILFYFGALLFVVGLFRLKRDLADPWGATLIGLVGAGYLVGPVVMLFARHEIRENYLMPAFAVMMPITAVGLVAVTRARPVWIAALLILFGGAGAAKSVRPRHSNALPTRQAGEWIRATNGEGRTVIGDDRRIEYYSHGKYRGMEETWAPFEAASAPGDIAAIIPDHAAHFEKGMFDRLDREWKFLASFPPENPRMMLYQKP